MPAFFQRCIAAGGRKRKAEIEYAAFFAGRAALVVVMWEDRVFTHAKINKYGEAQWHVR